MNSNPSTKQDLLNLEKKILTSTKQNLLDLEKRILTTTKQDVLDSEKKILTSTKQNLLDLEKRQRDELHKEIETTHEVLDIKINDFREEVNIKFDRVFQVLDTLVSEMETAREDRELRVAHDQHIVQMLHMHEKRITKLEQTISP